MAWVKWECAVRAWAVMCRDTKHQFSIGVFHDLRPERMSFKRMHKTISAANFGPLEDCFYPLVNIQKTREHQIFSWENVTIISMAIFNGYVVITRWYIP